MIQDNCVSVGVTLWELDVVLVNFQDEVVTGLNGTTRILFTGCWANFTDLSISANGEWSMAQRAPSSPLQGAGK